MMSLIVGACRSALILDNMPRAIFSLPPTSFFALFKLAHRSSTVFDAKTTSNVNLPFHSIT